MATRCWIRHCSFTVLFYRYNHLMKFFLRLVIIMTLPIQPIKAQVLNEPPENWCIQKVADQDGNDVFITTNLGYKNYAHKTDFPWCLAVNITTVHKYPNEHPTHEEAPILNATEDIITNALQQVGATKFVGRVTVNGYRELYYFVADQEKANAALTKLTKKR